MNKDNQQIKKLTDREQARTKLPIFFGSFDNFNHSLLEMLANARDEIINNFSSGEIIVNIEDDLQTISVFDTGRGIQLMGETDEIKNYELLFETLFAGGNYENIETGKFTTGTNGVGVACTNFTSKFFEVISYKQNKAYKVIYKDGGEFVDYIEEESDISNGTKVTWKLDENVYTNITYDIDFIKDILNKLSSTANNIKYILNFKNERFEYSYENQIEFIKNNAINNLTEIVQFPIKHYENNIVKEGINLVEKDNIIVALSLSSEPTHTTFLNGGYLKENGTILDGIIQGLKKVFSQEFKKIKLSDNDILMSFNIHCLFNSTNPIFHSQTKFSASNQLYKKLASKYIEENMEIIKLEKSKTYIKMVKHIETINKFNTKSTENIKKLQSTLNEKSTIFNKIDKLIECKEKDINKRTLLICEGDSALSSLITGRTKEQAIYPLRGKILNCLKANEEQIFNNSVIIDLLKILGCGIDLKSKYEKDFDTFNINNLQYNKIYIVVDADVDGIGSILPLVLTVFYTLTPKLLENGHIYLCETPKYEIETKDKDYYAKNDEDLEQIKKQLNGKNYKINYVKGLAELSAEAMSMCLTKQFNNVKQIKVNNIHINNEMLELFMGNDITKRKNYILENFNSFKKGE